MKHAVAIARWVIAIFGALDAYAKPSQLRNGQTFWDPSAPQSTSAISLPDPLQIKANGLQPHQAGVYEDFSKHFVMSNVSQFSLNFRYGPSTEDRKSAKFNRIL